MARKNNPTNHIRARSLEVGYHETPVSRKRLVGWLFKGALIGTTVVGGLRACHDITDKTTNGRPEGSSASGTSRFEPIAGCRVKIGKLGVYATLEDLDFPRKAELRGTVHVHNDPELPDQWEIFTPDGTPPDGKAYGGDINNYQFPSGTYLEAGAPRNFLTSTVCRQAGGRVITVTQHYSS